MIYEPTAGAAPPPRAVLLWLPALGVPARKYARFAQALAARGFTVGVHEWRGTGEHPLKAGRGSDWGYRELLQQDIPASAAALRQRTPDAPLLLGGHSIGGQFAVLAAALGDEAAGLVAIGSGVPHWRLFPTPLRWLVGGFGMVLPPLVKLVGAYPGERLGFGGREAARLMRDWAGTVRRGHYDALSGLPDDMSARLGRLDVPMLGLRHVDDRLVPAASMQALLDATGSRAAVHRVLDASDIGVAADHYAWMRTPGGVAAAVEGWWAEIDA